MRQDSSLDFYIQTIVGSGHCKRILRRINPLYARRCSQRCDHVAPQSNAFSSIVSQAHKAGPVEDGSDVQSHLEQFKSRSMLWEGGKGGKGSSQIMRLVDGGCWRCLVIDGNPLPPFFFFSSPEIQVFRISAHRNP